MNICFWGAIDSSGRGCGVASVTRGLRSIFMQHGHQVYILTSEYSEKNTEIPDGYVFLPEAQKVATPKNLSFLHCFCEEKKINVVISQENSELLAESFDVLRTRGIKVFSCIHCIPDVALTNFQDKFEGRLLELNAIARFFSRIGHFIRKTSKFHEEERTLHQDVASFLEHSDSVVLLSEGLKPVFQKYYKGDASVIAQKLRAISNPLCVHSKPETKKEVERKKQVLWVGRLKYRAKRPDRMLQIWKNVCQKCSDWELLFLGKGRDAKALEAYVKKMHIPNVRFCGEVATEEYYAKAEILCSTSTSEGFGMVLVEALENGVIPMAFNAFPSAREIIQDDCNGILVAPFSLEDYSNKLLALMQSESERQRLRMSSCNTLEAFSPEVIYKKWEQLFKEYGCADI